MMFVIDGKATTTPGIDVEVATGVKIWHVTPTRFYVLVVPTLEVIVGSGYGASFHAQKVFFGLSISTEVIPLLRHI